MFLLFYNFIISLLTFIPLRQTVNIEKVFMQEQHIIELYVSISDEQQNTQIEAQLTKLDLDSLVLSTLAFAGVTEQVMLTLLITDDESIREMNKQYREQDKATDVLSFPLLEVPLVEAPPDQLWEPLPQEEAPNTATTGSQQNTTFINPPGAITNLGDVVMSWPTLIRQAQEAQHETYIELLYLLAHGVLHLIGYDDQTEAGYDAMVHIQRAVLDANGYNYKA